MSFTCWWCDQTIEEEDTLIRSYPGVMKEKFCPSCANELDQWTEEQWERHYDYFLDDDGGWSLFEPRKSRTCRVEGCEGIPEPDEDYCDEHILEP